MPKIIFAGGGTGGHLFTGIALAEACDRTKNEILFVGTEYGLEKTVVPQLGFRLEIIPVKPLKGKDPLQFLKGLLQIPYSLARSFLLLLHEKPDWVIGIGGYASGPVTLMARMMRIQTAIVEQNSYPGMTNRILGKFVHRIFIAFENARKFFSPDRTFLTGNPVRKSFFEMSPSPLKGEDKKLFTLLVLGGSQGAYSINQAMIEAIPFFLKEKIQIIHQTGKNDLSTVKSAYETAGLTVEVIDFIQEIQACYQKADLVVSRSGAGTVTEIETMGKDSILIPSAHAADDYQRFNALELVNAGAARMIANSELSGERLFGMVQELMHDPTEIVMMSQRARSLAKPNAAKEILKSCKIPF